MAAGEEHRGDCARGLAAAARLPQSPGALRGDTRAYVLVIVT